MGNQTIGNLRGLALLVCLLILAVASCSRSSPTAVESPAGVRDTPIPGTSQATLVEEMPTPATPASAGQIPPSLTPLSPTPSSPIPLSPTPLSPALLTPQPISPASAPELRPHQQHAFSPWEHVLGIVWSPDGERLAVAAGDAIYLFERSSLQVKLRLEPGAAAPAMSISPDGRRLAAGDRNGVLYVWDAESGQLLHEMQAHQKSISAVAYSPYGATLATAGYDAVARLWDAGSYSELSEMIGGTFAIPAIAFTPDGSSLAIVNGNVIRLRDSQTSRFVRTIVGEEPFYSLAFSPDGSYLAAGDVDNTITIWDMDEAPGLGGETRTSLHTLTGQTGHSGRSGRPESLVWQVSYSPDGSLLASAGGDATVRLWDANQAQHLATLSGHSLAATSAVYSPDGRWLATGGLDGLLIVWGVD